MTDHPPPIGVFDSGLGGLSVGREIASLLPGEDVLYVADSAYCPYGSKTVEEIHTRALLIGREIAAVGAKILVMACNTACAAALEDVRAALAIPVIGLEPAVKPAVQVTRTGKIGVLATSRTVASPRLSGLITRYAHDTVVYTVPAPNLVDLVEAGETDGVRVDMAVWTLVRPLLDRGVDAVVLGCTHFPFLREAVHRMVGPDVAVIDSGPAVALRVRGILAERGSLAPVGREGSLRLMTTGDPASVAPVAASLLGHSVEFQRLSPSTLSAADWGVSSKGLGS